MNPVDRIIARFGGNAELAKLLGIHRNQPGLWRRRGRIPAMWLDSVLIAGTILDPPLDPWDFFGEDARDAAQKAKRRSRAAAD